MTYLAWKFDAVAFTEGKFAALMLLAEEVSTPFGQEYMVALRSLEAKHNTWHMLNHLDQDLLEALELSLWCQSMADEATQ